MGSVEITAPGLAVTRVGGVCVTLATVLPINIQITRYVIHDLPWDQLHIGAQVRMPVARRRRWRSEYAGIHDRDTNICTRTRCGLPGQRRLNQWQTPLATVEWIIVRGHLLGGIEVVRLRRCHTGLLLQLPDPFQGFLTRTFSLPGRHGCQVSWPVTAHQPGTSTQFPAL